MSSTKSQDNKAIVDRWFTEFWGKSWNRKIVEELGAPGSGAAATGQEHKRQHEACRHQSCHCNLSDPSDGVREILNGRNTSLHIDARLLGPR